MKPAHVIAVKKWDVGIVFTFVPPSLTANIKNVNLIMFYVIMTANE